MIGYEKGNMLTGYSRLPPVGNHWPKLRVDETHHAHPATPSQPSQNFPSIHPATPGPWMDAEGCIKQLRLVLVLLYILLLRGGWHLQVVFIDLRLVAGWGGREASACPLNLHARSMHRKCKPSDVRALQSPAETMVGILSVCCQGMCQGM